MTAGDLDWQQRAACHGSAVLFFGPEDEKPGDQRWREAQAKAICAECPVRRQCLAHALITPIRWGVWGQTGEAERYQLRRKYLRRQRGYAA